MKKRIYYLLGSALLLAAALRLATLPAARLFTGAARAQEAEAARRAEVDAQYQVSFLFAKGAGKAPAFLPRYAEVPYADALETAARFALFAADLVEETRAEWVFERGGKRLAVNKRLNAFSYTDAAPTARTGGAAADVAEGFIRGLGLPLAYVETVVTPVEGGHEALFIAKTAALPDYAFPIAATVANGAVTRLDYARPAYERLASCPLITMREAFYRLPVTDLSTPVDIRRCTLVYRFADSIVQPAYLFEGEKPGGEAFRAYVDASKYD